MATRQQEEIVMTQLGSGQSPVGRQRPESDIYTVLLAIAAAFVLAGTIYVCVQSSNVFGSLFPPAGG